MANVEDLLTRLRAKARPDQLAGMARFGINPEKRLGVSMPDLRKIAKETKKDHPLALALWETGIAEARIVAALVAEPEKLTGQRMDAWSEEFNSWDVCDQVCMNLFDKTPLIWGKIFIWASCEKEFVRRAAFSAIACLAWHDKSSKDKEFLKFFPLMLDAATDERNYVKKSVSWALRQIGKRSEWLRTRALSTSYEMRKMDSRPARWIASDVIRELENETTRSRMEKKLRKTD